MKHRTEILISIGIVIIAITASIISGYHDTTGETNQQTAPLVTTLSPDKKKQRCMENTTRANQIIKESLALVNALNQGDVGERQALEQHLEKINAAKKSLKECQTLVKGYEEKIGDLEAKIKALQAMP